MPLIVIRGEPGCTRTVAGALELGLNPRAFPLFTARPLAWAAPDPSGFDGVLVGSANVFRHGGAGLAALRSLPVHAVGETTAEAAHNAGFRVAATGEGGLQGVLDIVPAGTRLLRLAGAERIVLTPPPGVTVAEQLVYEIIPAPMHEELVRLLRAPAVIALHSAEAARHFRAECERTGIDRALHLLAVIGPRVAEAAGPGWGAIGVAPRPAETALLAKAAELCQITASERGRT